MAADRWDEHEAAACADDLALRIYTSRLLGRDPALVLHGGGNTSLKTTAADLFGEAEEIIRIKGSGWDLATIEAAGLPALRLGPLRRLRALAALDDPQMVNQLRAQLLDMRSPDPSVETLLHAFLPHRYIDHTHADAVLTLTNQPEGERLVRELYGARVGIVPSIMPGFRLAVACAEAFERDPTVIGLVLLRHGVFSVADSARDSYRRMLEIVSLAEAGLAARRRPRGRTVSVASGGGAAAAATPIPAAAPAPAAEGQSLWWAHALRGALLERGWRASCLVDASPEARAFAAHPEIARIAQQGPLTPDHVIRTKRLPLMLAESEVRARAQVELGARLTRYAEDYRAYFERWRSRSAIPLTMLDPWPRLAILPGMGVACLGSTPREARIAQDLYRRTMQVILDAEDCSSYQALPEEDLFDMEYWSLEQAKLALGPRRLPLTGKTAVVSGGASGIGLAIARELLAQGASVAVLDVNEQALAARGAELAVLCKSGNVALTARADVRDRAQVRAGVAAAISATGGVDIVVVNAGVFTPSANIEDITAEQWERALGINCDGAFNLIAEALPWLKRQRGGDIVVIASKNVPAPGKQAAAYSVSKAAQAQLARVCALEAGAHGVRVNMLHPHLVLDTEIWTEAVVASRAAAYGMTVEQYRTNNLLRTEISSRDVARATCALVSGSFDKTTGAQICVDGGSERTL